MICGVKFAVAIDGGATKPAPFKKPKGCGTLKSEALRLGCGEGLATGPIGLKISARPGGSRRTI
jgi:hypothetical protein